MARVPTREADVVALAGDIIAGLTQYTEQFPSPPTTPEELRTAADAYNAAREKAVGAEGTAAEAHDVKDDALQTLIDGMRAVLRYAEETARYDDGKLKLLGWSGRRTRNELEPPGQVRTLEVKREGPGWVFLDWKPPFQGGVVAAYRIQRRVRADGDWVDVGMALETQMVLANQERAVEYEYQVFAANKAGEGESSNVVSAVL